MSVLKQEKSSNDILYRLLCGINLICGFFQNPMSNPFHFSLFFLVACIIVIFVPIILPPFKLHLACIIEASTTCLPQAHYRTEFTSSIVHHLHWPSLDTNPMLLPTITISIFGELQPPMVFNATSNTTRLSLVIPSPQQLV